MYLPVAGVHVDFFDVAYPVVEGDAVVIILAAYNHVVVLFIAGCSLAVAMGGSLVERKRPFGLLRVAGMSLKQLRRMVLVESIVPLVTAAILASVLGTLVAAITKPENTRFE